MRPGQEHDTAAGRAHPELLAALAGIRTDPRTLGDLGYEGEADTIIVAFKTPAHRQLSTAQQMVNKAHNGSPGRR